MIRYASLLIRRIHWFLCGWSSPFTRSAVILLILGTVSLTVVDMDRHWPQWAMLLGLMIVYLMTRLWAISPMLALGFAYTGGYGVYIALNRLNGYSNLATTDVLITKFHAYEYLVPLLVLAWLFTDSVLFYHRHLLKRFYIAVIVLTIVHWSWLGLGYGVTGNFGMNASLLSILSCFGSPWLLLSTGALVLLSGASTPLLVFGVVVAVRFREIFLRYWYFTAAFLVSGYYAIKTFFPVYLDDSQRFKLWALYWDAIKAAPLFGYGPGQFKSWGPVLQLEHYPSMTDSVLLWAHNEYLQIAFEFGAFGLVLALAVWGSALWSARTSRDFQAALMGIAAWSLTDYPLRLAIPCFIVCMVVRGAFSSWRVG